MYKLHYSDQARDDLANIRKYISRRSGHKKTGLDFTKSLRVKCKALASFQGTIGVSRPDLGQGIRAHPFGNYVILFMYEADFFKVVTIVEGHRDIEALFRDEE